MLDRPAAAALLPRPARRALRERAGPGALALLHQHLPELGARAPLPDARPQRRDQHAARQPQLDARARAAARLAAVRRRHRRRSAPLLRDDISDSASLDGLMELLVLGGRSPAHAISMLIPEAYQGRPELPQEVRDFYAYHSSLVEPWDGPAAVAFTDGRVIGATLDRNGLRPGRWLVTRDGWVVLASETGVLDVEPRTVDGQGPAAAGQAVPGRPRARPDRAGRARSSADWPRAAPTASGCATASSTSRTCPRRARACRAWSRCGPSSSPSGGARRTCG